jgi:aminobenzoyl-glutamate utilization protein B
MNKQQAIGAIDQHQDTIIRVNDKIWEYAELSLMEHQSAALYCKVLDDLGFEVQSGVAEMPTAFIGRYGSGRPVIGILAEYDALSGLSQKGGSAEKSPITPGGHGHGCGHNCLGAGSLAAAVAVKAYLENNPQKSGTVIFYGCPGEEGGSGKGFMARAGIFEELDAAITWHPNSANEVTTGSNNACLLLEYKFTGVASHAAGDPHLGRSHWTPWN